jgi:hypothetical protein
MTEPLELTDVWRRSLEATVQFYSTLGKLAADCLETLLATTAGTDSGPNSDANVPTPVAVNQERTATKPAPVSMMVLEAEAGRKALGLFMVENGFSRAVSAAVTASPFVDDQGNEIKAMVEFQPTSVTLQPGEQSLVKVLASIHKNMPAGIRYRGEIGVPGLMGTRIPVVLERTAEAKAPKPGKAHPTSPAGARRRTAGKNSPPGKSRKRAAKA